MTFFAIRECRSRAKSFAHLLRKVFGIASAVSLFFVGFFCVFFPVVFFPVVFLVVVFFFTPFFAVWADFFTDVFGVFAVFLTGVCLLEAFVRFGVPFTGSAASCSSFAGTICLILFEGVERFFSVKSEASRLSRPVFLLRFIAIGLWSQ